MRPNLSLAAARRRMIAVFRSDAETFFERTQIGWHAAYFGLLAVMAVVWLLVDAPTHERITALSLLVGMAVLYQVAGRRTLGCLDVRRGLIYLVPTWAALTSLIWLDGFAYVLLFVLFPQIWAMLPTRWAVGFLIVGVNALVVAQMASEAWTAAAVRQALISGVIQIGVSLMLGLWIVGMLAESERRGELIKELTLTRSELAASEHERGVLAERQRLSHEIHDTLAQGFTSILTLAQAIEIALDRDPTAVRERLALLEQTARENLSEARALVADLGPIDLHSSTLEEAVTRLARRLERERGMEVIVEVTGDPHPLSANAEVVLLRAVQESLNNIRKHSGATTARVRLVYGADTTSLEVADNGCGFDPESPRGFGLHGMRTRVEQVGGAFAVSSAIGEGTSVRVCLT